MLEKEANPSLSKSTGLPRKRFYRARAHSNPLSDSHFPIPISPSHVDYSDHYPRHGGSPQRIEFADIGCGFGGLLISLATLFPETLMIGMELRDKVTEYVKERIVALRGTTPGQYQNVSVVRTNSMKYVPNYFEKGQLLKMFFLFPDPHFKEKNHRRRVISPHLLDEYAYALRVGGVIYTITDVEELGEWMRGCLEDHPMFEALTSEELKADPVVELLSTATEEGQKVSRNGGRTFPAVVGPVTEIPREVKDFQSFVSFLSATKMATEASTISSSAMVSLRTSVSSKPLEPLKSSFVRFGVETLRVPRLRIAHSDGFRRNCHGGGAQMNLFSRFARVVKSYASAILSSFEDPEKILDQTVVDMNNDLIKMRQATAQVLASQKQLENKYKSAQQASEDWYRRAQLALSKGDEDLAREALKRRKSYADNANALKTQLDQQKSVVDNLVSNTRLLESKIQEARAKKDVLKARAQSAKTSTKVSELLGNVDTSSALDVFNKMEEKVLAMESQAEALNELTTDDLEGKFRLLESSSVDGDLENLKKELSGRSKKGELPAARSDVTLKSVFPYRESEIEEELNELRRKAKDF